MKNTGVSMGVKIVKVVGEVITFEDGTTGYLPFEDFEHLELPVLNKVYCDVMEIGQRLQEVRGSGMKNMKSCVLCARYTRNRKTYTVSNTGKVGVICNYCKEHGRVEANDCKSIK